MIDGSGRTRPIVEPMTEPVAEDAPQPETVANVQVSEEAQADNPFVGGSPPLPDGSTGSGDDEALG